MSMKPIEPGCLAIVIAGDDIGRCVTCIKRIEKGFTFRTPPPELKRVTIPCASWTTQERDEEYTCLRFEHHLRRIDGGEDETLTVEEEQEVSA